MSEQDLDARRLLAQSVAWHAAATEALGQALGQELPERSLLALRGELGAGKTTLVRGLARGLGCSVAVSSPTYTLMRQYEGGRLVLHHFDAWMAGRERAFLEGGGVEDLVSDQALAAVEWPERVAPWLPVPHLEIEFALCQASDPSQPPGRELRLWWVGGDAGSADPRQLAALRAWQAWQSCLAQEKR